MIIALMNDDASSSVGEVEVVVGRVVVETHREGADCINDWLTGVPDENGEPPVAQVPTVPVVEEPTVPEVVLESTI